MLRLKGDRPTNWTDFTPPRSAQLRRSSGRFCHRRIQTSYADTALTDVGPPAGANTVRLQLRCKKNLPRWDAGAMGCRQPDPRPPRSKSITSSVIHSLIVNDLAIDLAPSTVPA